MSQFYFGQIVHGNRDLMPDFQEQLNKTLREQEMLRMFPEYFDAVYKAEKSEQTESSVITP